VSVPPARASRGATIGRRSQAFRPRKGPLFTPPPQTTGPAPASSPARLRGGAADCNFCLSAPPGARQSWSVIAIISTIRRAGITCCTDCFDPDLLLARDEKISRFDSARRGRGTGLENDPRPPWAARASRLIVRRQNQGRSSRQHCNSRPATGLKFIAITDPGLPAPGGADKQSCNPPRPPQPVPVN